jgi:hypothetical protein
VRGDAAERANLAQTNDNEGKIPRDRDWSEARLDYSRAARLIHAASCVAVSDQAPGAVPAWTSRFASNHAHSAWDGVFLLKYKEEILGREPADSKEARRHAFRTGVPVLVTGATGNVGRHVVSQLTATGARSMPPALANSPVKVIPSRVRLEDFYLESTEPFERGLDCLA